MISVKRKLMKTILNIKIPQVKTGDEALGSGPGRPPEKALLHPHRTGYPGGGAPRGMTWTAVALNEAVTLFPSSRQQLFEGLARHVGNQIEAAIHADPVEEAERRDRPDRSGKDVPGARTGRRGVRGEGHMLRPDAAEHLLADPDMAHRLDLAALPRRR